MPRYDIGIEAILKKNMTWRICTVDTEVFSLCGVGDVINRESGTGDLY